MLKLIASCRYVTKAILQDKKNAMGIVEEANALPLQTFKRAYGFRDTEELWFIHFMTGLEYKFTLETSTSISDVDFEACFNLIRETSEENYRNSSIKWSPAKKRKEMKLPDLRYLLVKAIPGSDDVELTRQPVMLSIEPPDEAVISHPQVEAFLSFMCTYEDGHEVIYCYEIHLAASIRDCGLGTKMMVLMEEAGRLIGLEKAMLTVFVANRGALAFYEKCG